MTGYGSDIWCTPEAGLITARFARGRTLVVQALARRLATPRGTLAGGRDEGAYGIDLTDWIGAPASRAKLASLPGVIRSELLKDDRVSDVSVRVDATTDAGSLVTIEINADVLLSDEGAAFPLTMVVSDVGIEIVGSPS